MLSEILKDYTIILASGSPRRHQFFKDLGIKFKVEVKPVNEIFPNNLKKQEITNYLSKRKADAFAETLGQKEILVTSDTIVWHGENQMGKPNDTYEAKAMLTKLSNDWHSVFTSVCCTTTTQQKIVSCETKVKFKALTGTEIDYYVENFNPLDKAGAYGIQEWIGLIGVEEIKGSYPNVVGLPTHLVYKTLAAMANR